MKNRKWLSLLLAMTMLFTCIPGNILAEGEEDVFEAPAAVKETVVL